MSMTLQELCDWHAKRAGWNEPGTEIPNIWEPTTQATYAEIASKAWWKVDANFKFVATSHPFQPTLDGADASFPPGINWYRGEKVWNKGRFVPQWWAFTTKGKPIGPILATDSKPRDLYELSKLAWEQEAAR